MAKYVWSLTAHVLGVTCRPTNFDQFWEWAEQYIQNSKKFHMVGLAAICWALWRSMNNVFFENKKVRSDWGCLVCLACSFLDYWEGLQKNDDMVLLQAGAGVLKPAVLEFDAQVYSAPRRGPICCWLDFLEALVGRLTCVEDALMRLSSWSLLLAPGGCHISPVSRSGDSPGCCCKISGCFFCCWF